MTSGSRSLCHDHQESTEMVVGRREVDLHRVYMLTRVTDYTFNSVGLGSECSILLGDPMCFF